MMRIAASTGYGLATYGHYAAGIRDCKLSSAKSTVKYSPDVARQPVQKEDATNSSEIDLAARFRGRKP